MSTRRDGREWVIQLLFQLELNPGELDEALPAFWSDKTPDKKTQAFAEAHVQGIYDNIESIDAMLTKCAEHWDINRMGIVDRSVMRMSIYEIMFCDDIPAIVSINEGVDLAKYFSSSESGKFVNGILDRARKDTEQSGVEGQGSEVKKDGETEALD